MIDYLIVGECLAALILIGPMRPLPPLSRAVIYTGFALLIVAWPGFLIAGIVVAAIKHVRGES